MVVSDRSGQVTWQPGGNLVLELGPGGGQVGHLLSLFQPSSEGRFKCIRLHTLVLELGPGGGQVDWGSVDVWNQWVVGEPHCVPETAHRVATRCQEVLESQQDSSFCNGRSDTSSSSPL